MPRTHRIGELPGGPERYSTAWAARHPDGTSPRRCPFDASPSGQSPPRHDPFDRSDEDGWDYHLPAAVDPLQRGATVVIALSAIAAAIAALTAAFPH